MSQAWMIQVRVAAPNSPSSPTVSNSIRNRLTSSRSRTRVSSLERARGQRTFDSGNDPEGLGALGSQILGAGLTLQPLRRDVLDRDANIVRFASPRELPENERQSHRRRDDSGERPELPRGVALPKGLAPDEPPGPDQIERRRQVDQVFLVIVICTVVFKQAGEEFVRCGPECRQRHLSATHGHTPCTFSHP